MCNVENCPREEKTVIFFASLYDFLLQSFRMAARKKAVAVGDDQIKRSLLGLAIGAIGVILLLAFVGLAGTFGARIDYVLATLFGLPRIFVAIFFLLAAADVVFSTQRWVTVLSLSAVGSFVLGLCGLLNLLFALNPATTERLVHAGGYVGLLLSLHLAKAFGGLVAALVAVVLILAAVVIIFGVSLDRLLAAPMAFLQREPAEEDDDESPKFVGDDLPEETVVAEAEEEEIEPEEVDEEEEEEDDSEEAPKKKTPVIYGGPQESVMTVSERRTISIPMDLLDNKRSEAKSGDINRNHEIIARTLEQFGIPVEMAEVRVGPTVTQYAFRPAQGVKLSRIVALQNDLALALAAHPIRIEAPIPGKALVGVEVPNIAVARVSLREILESSDFEKRKSAYSVPLGKDIAGTVPLLVVEKAPHMLVAGATGSGKSVCLNTLIVSLLYQNGPDDLKLIMVDPKRVELGVYAGIPHLLVPPITKADEAVNALKWGVREMERRLDYLAKFGARDIDSYNAKSKERMPRIIIVIDELADLMLQNKRDVEATIVRIAQMARATGIHLILATQRPSVDVITGTIKANIPTRLAFAVASQVDSKTILDVSGAEKLLGRGDMLYMNPEISKPRRVQGAFVSDEEITRVVDFLKQESEPDYNYQITESGGAGGVALNPDDADPLLDEAINIAIEAGRVSTSFLQRRMKVGYSRAARIVDLMEQLGVVGAADGAKPREVLVDSWPPERFDEEHEASDDSEDAAEDVAEIEEFDIPDLDENEFSTGPVAEEDKEV